MNEDKVASASLILVIRLAAMLALSCSLLLYLDYLLPGSFTQTTIKRSETTIPRPGSSTFTSHTVITEKYRFPISWVSLSKLKVGDNVRLKVSPFLKIVNNYQLKEDKEFQTYYTRYLSGIFFPLVLLLVALFSLRIKNASERTLYILITLAVFAVFFTVMTIISESNLF